MSMFMERPRGQMPTSCPTWVSSLISAASVTLMFAISQFADSHIIRNSIARKDSVTLSIEVSR